MLEILTTAAALLAPFLAIVAAGALAVAVNDAAARALARRRVRRDLARGPWSPR